MSSYPAVGHSKAIFFWFVLFITSFLFLSSHFLFHSSLLLFLSPRLLFSRHIDPPFISLFPCPYSLPVPYHFEHPFDRSHRKTKRGTKTTEKRTSEMSISPRFSSYVTSIICSTVISTTLICSILSPPAYPSSSDPFSGSSTGHCYSPSAMSDGAESTLPAQSCLPCRSHRRGHGSASSGSTLPLTVSYESISGPFRSKPKRKQESLIYFVDCWDPSDSVDNGGSDGNNDLSQEPSSLFGDNTYLKTLFDQYPFLYRIQKLDMMRTMLPQDQDPQETKKANELHHPLFRHKKLYSFKGFSSTSSSPLQQYSPGNKTRNKRKRTPHHTKNTGTMPPLYSQRRRYPSPQDIQPPHQNQRCCYLYPLQRDSGPYRDSQQKERPSLLDSLESIATTWKVTRQSALRALRLIQTEFYHGGSQAYDEDLTGHSHTPFRIKPHPKLESLASNLLVRSCLLIVLCMGAFWYCVTMMDQQQQHLGGSNWRVDLGSETAAPSSIAASSSLGTTTSGSTTSLGVDIGNDRLSSPPTPQEANSAQSTRPDPAVPHEGRGERKFIHAPIKRRGINLPIRLRFEPLVPEHRNHYCIYPLHRSSRGGILTLVDILQ